MTEKKTPHATGSTTQAGIPAVSDRNSLTVGNNGPIVLHDHHLVETLAHFNRMNVPERRPHGLGCLRHLRGHRGRLAVHQGRLPAAGQEDRDAGPLLHRGRRAGLPGHLA